MSANPVNQPFLRRRLEGVLAESLVDTPVVCILGPRQCGKSTLAQRHAPDRPYISLDDRNFHQLATMDPQGFIDDLPEFVTIDEVHGCQSFF